MAVRTWRWWVVAVSLCAACDGTATGAGDAGQLVIEPPVVVLGDDAGVPGQAISGQVSVLEAPSSQGVTLTLQPGDSTTVTDVNASFIFPSVATGSYTLTASLAGYASTSQTVVVTEGNDQSVQLTLERSQPLALLPDASAAGAPFIAYDQWIHDPDAGRLPGTTFVFGYGGNVWELVDGGASLATGGNPSASLLGFDSQGSAVVSVPTGQASPNLIDFIDAAGVSSFSQQGQSPTVSGAALFTEDRQPGSESWLAEAPGFVAAQSVALGISILTPPVVVDDGIAGWQTDPCPSVELFGVGLSVPLTVGCAGEVTPLGASLDGDRLAFVAVPDAGNWEVVIEDQTAAVLADGLIETLSDVPLNVYPLTANSYALPHADIDWVDGGPVDAGLHLLVDGPSGAADFPIAGWAPMHGDGALMATLSDAGETTLTVVGTSVSIPFPYPWSAPQFSGSNRYVAFPGVPSIFDLTAQIEAPIVLTPTRVVFDRAETHALVTDAYGNLALIALGQLNGGPVLQGVALEGVASVASFTADEQSVAYFGQDPENNLGFFVEAFPSAGAGGTASGME